MDTFVGGDDTIDVGTTVNGDPIIGAVSAPNKRVLGIKVRN
jgi:hypothetical protein